MDSTEIKIAGYAVLLLAAAMLIANNRPAAPQFSGFGAGTAATEVAMTRIPNRAGFP